MNVDEDVAQLERDAQEIGQVVKCTVLVRDDLSKDHEIIYGGCFLLKILSQDVGRDGLLHEFISDFVLLILG